MVQFEIDAQLFHDDLPANKLAHILHQSLNGIHDYLKHFHQLNIEQNIHKYKGIYNGKMSTHLMTAVDEHFMIFKKAFDR